ncbi:MAG TPA: hypothetical protein VIV60_06585 [Polyangiaceae bacterium]
MKWSPLRNRLRTVEMIEDVARFPKLEDAGSRASSEVLVEIHVPCDSFGTY